MNDNFYQIHAEDYFKQTVALEMDDLYKEFLRCLPEGGNILDAGCGSGRDAKCFLEKGYKVNAFDASSELARMASESLSIDVNLMRFQDLDDELAYDGIWACASLLHVPAQELHDVFCRLSRALSTKGVLYASFKYGNGEIDRGDRHFTDLDETGLADLLNTVVGFEEVKTWISVDVRPGRAEEKWLNMILRKEEV